MDELPYAAYFDQPVRQHAFYLRDLAARESVIFAKFDRPGRTFQIKHSLTAAPDHMYVRWPMIVRVDNDPNSAEAEDRRQRSIVSKFPSPWVFSANEQGCRFESMKD